MLPHWKQWCFRLFLGTLFVIAEAKHFDSSQSPQSSHGHQSRRNMGTDYHSPQSLLANEHRVTNVTTQIGTNAFLPCKVRAMALHCLSVCPPHPLHSSTGTPIGQQVRVLDPRARRPHTHRGPTHLHRRRPLPGLLRGQHGHVDAADQICPGQRRRHVRVPGGDGAQSQCTGPFARRR